MRRKEKMNENRHHNHRFDTTRNFNVIFAPHNNNRHESPVRDNQQSLFFKKEEEQYKDHYGVSNFKFPDITTTSSRRTNHSNFCELLFDGTKSSKHHHRRNNTIKRVTSATTINWSAKKEEVLPTTKETSLQGENEQHEQQKVIEEKNTKDSITFHHLAEQFKKKLKFIEAPVKLQKNVIYSNKQKGSTFEVILSPKPPTSYSSIETMSNMLQPSDHLHQQIILTTANKPSMRDREIQTAIIGIRNLNNMDECFNMRLSSVNDIFFLPSNEDLFNLKRKKRKKINLTVTNFPCVEIKCSSILFEMPANSVRPQMPRRTLNTTNTILEDYNEVASVPIEEKESSEPSITVNSSEATDNLKDKIYSLFNDTQIATTDDYNKKVNDLCGLIGNLLSENKSLDKNINIKKSVKLPGEMFINMTKLKASDKKRENKLIIPSYAPPKVYQKNSVLQKSSSTPRNRSRSVSPPSRPSTPTCQISKIPIAESSNLMYQTSPRIDNKFGSNTTPNLLSDIPNHRTFSFTSIPSASTTSSGSRNIRMVFEESDDNIKQPQQLATPVPRNVFLIPPHVNELLKTCEYNTNSTIRNEFFDDQIPSTSKSFESSRKADFNLVNILKKPPAKQSWVVPDFSSKPQVHHFQCKKTTKAKKVEHHDCGGPSVTFSSMVDVFGGDYDSFLEEPQPKCSTPESRNTIVPVTGFQKSKTYPNKPELYSMSNDNGVDASDSPQNCAFFAVRQIDTKPKSNNEKHASFFNSSFFSTKNSNATTSCLQKRKEYDNKLKMHLQQLQNKQASKIPLLKKTTEQDNNNNNNNAAIKNETTKTLVKSKLPLKVTNEVTNTKQTSSSKTQENSKLYTTDIKDTPFAKLKSENSTPRKQEPPQLDASASTPRPTSSILKNSRKNIENTLNVTKDVSNSKSQEKEIIYIKYPETNFHKFQFKFEVDLEKEDNRLLRRKHKHHNTNTNNNNNNNNKKTSLVITDTTNSTENSINKTSFARSPSLEFLLSKIENLKKEKLKTQPKSFCPHQNVIFVYQNEDKSIVNLFKRSSVTKRKKMMKQLQKEDSAYLRILEEKPPIIKDIKFKSSCAKIKPKINKVVTFIEPNKWASLCKIQQVGKCSCEERKDLCKQKLLDTKRNSKKSTINNIPKDKQEEPTTSSIKDIPPEPKKDSGKCCKNKPKDKKEEPKEEPRKSSIKDIPPEPKKDSEKCCKNKPNDKKEEPKKEPRKSSIKDIPPEPKKEPRKSSIKDIPPEPKKKPRKSSIKVIPPEPKKDSKKCCFKPKDKPCSSKNCPESPNYSQILKNCYENLCAGCAACAGIFDKQKDIPVRKSSTKKSLSAKFKWCTCPKRKNNGNAEYEYRERNSKKPSQFPSHFKQVLDNLIACCTTLCCKVQKDPNCKSKKSVAKSKQMFVYEKCKYKTNWLEVKPTRQKVYRVNSFKCCNSCFISTSKGVLAQRKRPNPAWKFKELIFNNMYLPFCSLSKEPKDLNNIIKYIQKEAFNHFPEFPTNENGHNLPDGHTIISPIADNAMDLSETFSTIQIDDKIEKFPKSLIKMKVVNKGRFANTRNKIKSSPRKITEQNVPTLPRKVVDTIYIPTSPRKSTPRKGNEIKEEFLLFPSKNADAIKHPKTREDIKQNVPTYPFSWTRSIPTSPKTVGDLKINTPRAATEKIEEISPKITNIVDIQQTANIEETEETVQIVEDRPIMVNTEKLSKETSPDSEFPRKKLRDIYPVIFDRATRKIYENRPRSPISPRQLDRKPMAKRTDEAKNSKLPIPKTNLPRPKNKVENTKPKTIIDDTKSNVEQNKPLLKRKNAKKFALSRKKQVSKFVIETNELVHIPDEDLVSLKSKDSKSTDYKSIVTYSGFSSNSQLSISSSSKRMSTSRTLFNIVGNFFRRYTKKVKRKKSKSNENG